MTNAVKKGSIGNSNTGISTVNLLVGSDIAPDDWIVGVLVFDNTANSVVTGPSGWTQIGSSGMGTRYISVWATKRGTESGTSYTFTLSANASAHARSIYGSGNTPLSGITATSATKRGVNVATLSTPAFTPPKAGLALLLVGEASAATTNEPGGYTLSSSSWTNQQVTQMSSQINSVITWDQRTTTADIPAATFTSPNASANAAAIVVHVPDTVDVVADLSLRVADSNGNLVPHAAKYVASDGSLAPLKSVVMVQKGKSSLDLFRTKAGDKPLVIAHRTGSIDWPEASLQGATQSLILGVDALEFPVARTSDGVFFGLHDATMNRTTPSLPADYNPSEHTWAEISALQNSVGNNAGLGPQPYTRLDEFLAIYGGKVLIFIDPKYVKPANYPELFALITAVPDYTNWIMGKYYITGTFVADAFSQRGMNTWGYAYTEDIGNNNIAANYSYWTYLGIEYSATKASWDYVRGWGRAVIGHIAPTYAAYQAAWSNGCIAVMTSGVRAVKTYVEQSEDI